MEEMKRDVGLRGYKLRHFVNIHLADRGIAKVRTSRYEL